MNVGCSFTIVRTTQNGLEIKVLGLSLEVKSYGKIVRFVCETDDTRHDSIPVIIEVQTNEIS